MRPHSSSPPVAATVPDAAIPVTAFRLENGMQVVVIPDRRSPIVTHMIWYRNGSTDDPPGKSGLAHFLEHLMFKGTADYPAGRFSALLASVGGEENAFTGWDFTAYHQRVPNEYLSTCMTYEADRMRNLALDEAVVATEREVILEERSMVADANPAGLLGEAVAVAAIPAHPAGRPIIGWRHEIEGLTRADALAYYRRFYTPENALLVVAGDAEPEAVHDLAARIYGAVPAAGSTDERRHPQDPPSRVHRQITLTDATVSEPQLTRLQMVPSPGTAVPGEAEALELLAFLLGGDETSILYTRLVVELACATRVQASYWSAYFRGPARFYIQGIPAPGTTPRDLDRSVDAVLADLRESGFEASAIARAKTQLVASALYARDSQVSLANWYGMALCCGLGLDDLATWEARIEAVTAEALLRALSLLARERGVSGHLIRSEAA
ncbi:M16 family metallopeptidase [Methylobacterium sp. J-090]|uniref:M16 family metallopeptidase n=1 Tax=Methylobacterium sp. J-090 TaxID=2836666 RepID=UPI001FBB7A16|nr:pitrilysin family protein [Methylobacterium sp. J-090]MCJ2081839.1 insulinase family protein [Methylobacterium sp. J-090]